MTVKTSTASNGLDLSSRVSEPPPSPPSIGSKSEPKKISRLTFSVDSLLNTVAKSASNTTSTVVPASKEMEAEPPLDDEEEDIDVESEEDLEEETVKTEPEDQSSPNLVHPRPLLAGGQPPHLALGLAAMAAAAAAGKQDSPNPGLFPGLHGFPSPSGMPPGFPPMGFPGLPHPFFKPGKKRKIISTLVIKMNQFSKNSHIST